MATLDLARATTVDVIDALHRHEVSSVELLHAMSDNIDRLNPIVNAVVATDLDGAEAEASAADDLRASGEPMGILHGVPMTIKDCYETLGLVTTAGAPELAEHMPERDAEVVRLLRRAGAIVWAKTNVPLYAGDHQTYNDVYGITNNPWDPSRTAGGSSGGSAVSVACGFTTAEVGSDIGNSIRQPAANNGVFGLKTTHGLIPGRGHIPGSPGALTIADLGVFGPLGRSCDDLRVMLDVLTAAGTAFHGVPGASLPRFDRPPPASRLRIGMWLDDPLSPVDNVVQRAIESAGWLLEAEGASVDIDARPSFSSDDLHRTYLRLLNAAMADSVPGDLWRELFDASDGDWDEGGNDYLTYARDVTLPHRHWIETNERRAAMQLAWADLFEEIDVMLTPVQPVPAFPHDTERSYGKRRLTVNGIEVPYRGILFWAGLATMPLLPSVVIPVGTSPEGLPIGMQVIGPRWSDHKLLDMAEEIATVIGSRFNPPPIATQQPALF